MGLETWTSRLARPGIWGRGAGGFCKAVKKSSACDEAGTLTELRDQARLSNSDRAAKLDGTRAAVVQYGSKYVIPSQTHGSCLYWVCIYGKQVEQG